MQDNWQSLESARIHKKIRHVAKFGNDDDAVDETVKDVFDSYLKLLPQYRTQRYQQGPAVSCYTMSTSNITSYVPNGFVVGATPDGRFAGTPLNEGCSPTQGTDTNVIDSATLRLAQEHPQDYTDLIVRVAGYCAQFVSLMPEAQEAIIARTENTW